MLQPTPSFAFAARFEGATIATERQELLRGLVSNHPIDMVVAHARIILPAQVPTLNSWRERPGRGFALAIAGQIVCERLIDSHPRRTGWRALLDLTGKVDLLNLDAIPHPG